MKYNFQPEFAANRPNREKGLAFQQIYLVNALVAAWPGRMAYAEIYIGVCYY